ncbi:MAG: acyl-CoA thioesterase [Candidatus Sigynarchaeota archaeon]
MAKKELIVSKLCKTFDLGVNGNLFGGRMLEWLDEAGGIYAYKQLRGHVATVKVIEIVFKLPVHERDIIDMMGTLKDVGHTSITIEMDAVDMTSSALVCNC